MAKQGEAGSALFGWLILISLQANRQVHDNDYGSSNSVKGRVSKSTGL